MKEITLKRFCTSEFGTFGVLIDKDIPLCLTLEDPDNGNQKNISCIPTGVYSCSRVQSPSKGDVWEIKDVPDRTHILIHVGNTIMDTEGCVLVGESFGTVHNLPAILNSTKTMKKLKTLLPDEFLLIIKA